MNVDFSNIGKRIQATRVANKISLEEMADFLSISVNDIINFENGEATIELKTFTQICDFLNISIYDVLNEKSDNIIRYLGKDLYELIIKCNLEKQ